MDRDTFVSDQIQGTLEAPSNRSVWLDGNDHPDRWITFEDIDNLHVTGGGTLNGNGQEWWINSCKRNKSMVCTWSLAPPCPTSVCTHSCDRKPDSLNLLPFRTAMRPWPDGTLLTPRLV
jgi:hypothetical protein